MKFDGTITWAVVFGAIGLLLTNMGVLFALYRRFNAMEVKLELIFDWWRRMWEPTMPIPDAHVLRRFRRRHEQGEIK